MGLGIRAWWRAQLRGSVRLISAGRVSAGTRFPGPRSRLGLGGAGLAMMVLGAFPAATAERPSGDVQPLRLVLAASPRAHRGLTVQTVSLYAKNDPWKAFLAGESVCPGGERTDLPIARQVETVACLVNYARARRGLQPLAIHAALNGASVKKAKEIIRCQSFSHSPCGADWTAAVKSTGYQGLFGENLYVAQGPWGAPRVAVDAWLNSAPHRENLFGRKWREQGLALMQNESFGAYRDVALWVSVLGERSS